MKNKILLLIIAAVGALLITVSNGFSLPQYCADPGGRNCAACHQDESSCIITPPACTDNDGDFFAVEGGDCGPVDCDDNDPNTYPGAPEICEGNLNDCDGYLPDNEMDFDYDGFMICEGDCNDYDPAINPVAYDLPGNIIDENCDGSLGDCDPNAEWKNHGKFVRCVAHETDDLMELGILSEAEGDALINNAAQSDIGKK